MLADQGLWDVERVDQLVHTALRLLQLQNDRDPQRRGERPQQFARGLQHVARRQCGCRGTGVVVGLAVFGQIGNRFHYRSEYMR